MFCRPDNGIDNIVGVEVMEDPDDGHEEYGQDHVEQDSPKREDKKDDGIAARHMTRDLVSHKKSSYKYSVSGSTSGIGKAHV